MTPKRGCESVSHSLNYQFCPQTQKFNFALNSKKKKKTNTSVKCNVYARSATVARRAMINPLIGACRSSTSWKLIQSPSHTAMHNLVTIAHRSSTSCHWLSSVVCDTCWSSLPLLDRRCTFELSPVVVINNGKNNINHNYYCLIVIINNNNNNNNN